MDKLYNIIEIFENDPILLVSFGGSVFCLIAICHIIRSFIKIHKESVKQDFKDFEEIENFLDECYEYIEPSGKFLKFMADFLDNADIERLKPAVNDTLDLKNLRIQIEEGIKKAESMDIEIKYMRKKLFYAKQMKKKLYAAKNELWEKYYELSIKFISYCTYINKLRKEYHARFNADIS